MNKGYYSDGKYINKKDTVDRSQYVSEQRDNIYHNPQRHTLDVERQIFERNGFFNLDTRNAEVSRHYKNQQSKNTRDRGEITGEDYNISEIEQGMPMRDFVTNTRNVIDKDQQYNKYLDFDLYEKQSNLQNVSYHDPGSIDTSGFTQAYSNVDSENALLSVTEKMNPMNSIVDSINYLSILLFNSAQKMAHETKVVLSPYNIFVTFMMLYFGSSHESTKRLQYYFNIPDKTSCGATINDLCYLVKKSFSIVDQNILYIPDYISINPAFKSYLTSIGIIDNINVNNPNLEKTHINKMMHKLSNGIITNILNNQSIKKDNQILAINFMIFRTYWLNTFKKSMNNKQYFYTNNKKVVVEMMHANKVHGLYTENNSMRIVELPLINDFNFVLSVKLILFLGIIIQQI